MKCSKCQKKAVIFVRYGGFHLCRQHFFDFVEKRVKQELRKQFKLKKMKIAIGLSGGKDSVLTLYMLEKIFRNNPLITLEAICVDEGIVGYREHSIPVAQKLCDELEVPLHVVSFEEVVGQPLDEMVKGADERKPCSYCGVFRRLCLNSTAKDIGASLLAVGLNLDDVAQTILMNFARADIKKLSRLGPHKVVKEGLVPRILPLRVIPEREAFLFCLLKGLDFHHGECPYANLAHRGLFRDVLGTLETNTPGTRHAFLKSYEAISDCIIKKEAPQSLKTCQNCGEPASAAVCQTCLFLKEIRDQSSRE